MKHENFMFFFCKNAKSIRGIFNLTQQEMADTLGIKRSLLGAIEEGRTLGIDSVYKYSVVSGVSMNELLDTDINEEPPENVFHHIQEQL